jgi:beta-lactamase class A
MSNIKKRLVATLTAVVIAVLSAVFPLSAGAGDDGASQPAVAAPALLLSGDCTAVTVSWDAVPETNKYTLYMLYPNDKTYTKLVTTSLLFYTVSDLEANQKYKFKVAVNGTLSAAAAVTTAKPVALPAPLLDAAIQNDFVVSLQWNAVDEAERYAVFVLYPGDMKYTQLTETAKNQTNFKIKDLVVGNTYKFKVAAIDVVSDKTKRGELSEAVKVRLLTPAENSEAKFLPILKEIKASFKPEYGRVAVGFTDLETGYTYVSDKQQYYAASIIKLYVMEYAYEKVAAGKAKLSDKTSGGHNLKNDIEAMITWSDNYATFRIIEHFGFTNVRNWIAENYPDTALNNWMTMGNGKDNYTTAVDVLAFLQKLYDNKSVYPNDEMIAVMTRQTLINKIPRDIRNTKGVTVANKTGSFTYGTNDSIWVTNDSAIVFAESGDFALVCLASGVPAVYAAKVNDLMAKGAERLVTA